MEGTLRYIPSSKDVFLLGLAGKKAKVKAHGFRTSLLKKQIVADKTSYDSWKPSMKQRETNAWWDYISHQIDVSKELDADVVFPKIQVMSHWVQQIRKYGALQ